MKTVKTLFFYFQVLCESLEKSIFSLNTKTVSVTHMKGVNRFETVFGIIVNYDIYITFRILYY